MMALGLRENLYGSTFFLEVTKSFIDLMFNVLIEPYKDLFGVGVSIFLFLIMEETFPIEELLILETRLPLAALWILSKS